MVLTGSFPRDNCKGLPIIIFLTMSSITESLSVKPIMAAGRDFDGSPPSSIMPEGGIASSGILFRRSTVTYYRRRLCLCFWRKYILLVLLPTGYREIGWQWRWTASQVKEATQQQTRKAGGYNSCKSWYILCTSQYARKTSYRHTKEQRSSGKKCLLPTRQARPKLFDDDDGRGGGGDGELETDNPSVHLPTCGTLHPNNKVSLLSLSPPLAYRVDTIQLFRWIDRQWR